MPPLKFLVAISAVASLFGGLAAALGMSLLVSSAVAYGWFVLVLAVVVVVSKLQWRRDQRPADRADKVAA